MKVCHFHAQRQASTIGARISQAPSESWASAYVLQLWETGLLNQNLGPGYRVSNKGWPDLHGKKKYLSLVLIAVSLKSYFLSARVYQFKYSPVISCFLAGFFPLYRDTFAWSRSLSPKSALDEIFFFLYQEIDFLASLSEITESNLEVNNSILGKMSNLETWWLIFFPSWPQHQSYMSIYQ